MWWRIYILCYYHTYMRTMDSCLCSKETLQRLCSAFSARYHSLQHGNWWFTLRQLTWSTFTSWELDPRVPDPLPALRKVQASIRRNHRRHRKIFKWVCKDIVSSPCENFFLFINEKEKQKEREKERETLSRETKSTSTTTIYIYIGWYITLYVTRKLNSPKEK